MILNCAYASFCSGCDALTLDYENQKNLKIAKLKALLENIDLPKIQFQSFGTHGLRSRMDFTIDNGKFGLYSHLTKHIEDLPLCLQLSESLQKAYEKFRKVPAPIQKGSFRIRVSPSGEVGIWLDFSNEDIKSLLENKTYLEALKGIGHIEIGQKNKSLYVKPNGDWGLTTPELRPWSASVYRGQPVSLKSTIGSFTQPSHISNQWITGKIAEWCTSLEPKNILEFGSGIGNLSFPALAHSNSKLTALEFDALSFQALEANSTALGAIDRMTLLKGDFRKASSIGAGSFDLLLLNPARNGVGELLQRNLNPKNVIYMSCYPESFALDIQYLKSQGYSPSEIHIADQFPQTHHMEILSLWQK